uniref:Ubinuclein-1-like n=1 Tax=Myripristis murdjan TaxID=586833 RepID=A0A668A2H9_9TELE
MAESRRVQLTTLSHDAPVPAATGQPPLAAMEGKGSRPDLPADTEATVRYILTLVESDENTFPEFSYAHLVDCQSRHAVAKDGSPPTTFEGEENGDKNEVAAIVRKLEEKYGGNTKKMKDRIQDLVDIGYGYDDEDSFIDNSEAYDEFVPASITTKYGGFYVNSGLLQFRQASDTESEDCTTERKTLDPSKKRKLNGGHDQPKKKQCKEVGTMKTTVDSKTGLSTEVIVDEKKKKKKKAAGVLSVTNMLKKFQREKERERQREKEMAAPIIGTPTLPLCPADAAGGGGSGLADPLLSLIGSTNDHALIQAASAVDFDIDLDSLLDVTEESSQFKSLLQPAEETQPMLLSQSKADVQTQAQCQPPKSTMKTSAQSKPQPEPTQVLSETKTTSHCVPLLDGLPLALERRIEELTLAAKTSEGESKLKFFTPEINLILLDIELQCQEQGGQVRSKVYTHLSSFLPCSRETLLKRVKKLLLSHEDPMQKLKEAIDRAMPQQIASFHESCQAHARVKSSKATDDGKEGKQKGNVGSEDNVEERIRKRGPQKLFKWNEEIREYFFHVVKAKMHKYKMDRKGSQEMEVYLKTFLDNEVKALWPKGWMQPRRQKPKTEKRQSFFSGAAIVSSSSGESADSSSLQGTPPLKVDSTLDEGLIPRSPPLSVVEEGLDALKMVVDNKWEGGAAVDVGSLTPVETDKQSLCNTTSAPAAPGLSSLDLLAEQALAREQSVTDSISHEVLAAAVASAKYKPAVQHWSLGVSPPLPPPPPQSSPASSPGNREYHLLVPAVQQVTDFSGHGHNARCI